MSDALYGFNVTDVRLVRKCLDATPLSTVMRDGTLIGVRKTVDDAYAFGKLAYNSLAGPGASVPCEGWSTYTTSLADTFGYPALPGLATQQTSGPFWAGVKQLQQALHDEHTQFPNPLADFFFWSSKVQFGSRLDGDQQIFFFTCDQFYTRVPGETAFSRCNGTPWAKQKAIKTINGRSPADYIDEVARVTNNCNNRKDKAVRLNCMLQTNSRNMQQGNGMYPPNDGDMVVTFADGTITAGNAFDVALAAPVDHSSTIAEVQRFLERNPLFTELDRIFNIVPTEPTALELAPPETALADAHRRLDDVARACYAGHNLERVTVTGDTPWAKSGASFHVLKCTWTAGNGDVIEQWFPDLNMTWVSPFNQFKPKMVITAVQPNGSTPKTFALKYSTFAVPNEFTEQNSDGTRTLGIDSFLYMAKLATDLASGSEVVVDLVGNGGGSVRAASKAFQYLFGGVGSPKYSKPEDGCFYTNSRAPEHLLELASSIKAEGACLAANHADCTLKLDDPAYLAGLGMRLLEISTKFGEALYAAAPQYGSNPDAWLKIPGVEPLVQAAEDLNRTASCFLYQPSDITNDDSDCSFKQLAIQYLRVFGSNGADVAFAKYPKDPRMARTPRQVCQHGSIEECIDTWLTSYLPASTLDWGGQSATYTPYATDAWNFCAEVGAPQTKVKAFKVLSDGNPGSAASMFVTFAHSKQVATVVTFGGLKGQPMDMSSFNGGSKGDYNKLLPIHSFSSFFWSAIFSPTKSVTEHAYWPFPAANGGPRPNSLLSGYTEQAMVLVDLPGGSKQLPREWYKVPAPYHLDIWPSVSLNGDPGLTLSVTCAPDDADPIGSDCIAAPLSQFGMFSVGPWEQLFDLYVQAAAKPQHLFQCTPPQPQPDPSPHNGGNNGFPIWAIVLLSLAGAVVAGGIIALVAMKMGACRKADSAHDAAAQPTKADATDKV